MLVNLKRKIKPVGLSLVALMDVFTVLVFFLMFHFEDDQAMKNNFKLNLPSSTISSPVAKQQVISFVSNDIFLNDQVIAHFGKTISNRNELGAKLTELLQGQKDIAIEADSHIRYAIIDELVAALDTTKIENVSLVVNKIKG